MLKKIALLAVLIALPVLRLSAMDSVLVAGFLNQGEESDDNINEILSVETIIQNTIKGFERRMNEGHQ